MGEFETNMERIHDAANTSGVNFFTLRRHDKDVGKITVLKADLVRPVEENIPSALEPEPRQMPPMPSGLPESISVPDRPEFLDYLTGGCQISLAVAIDFTSSNGTWSGGYVESFCFVFYLALITLYRIMRCVGRRSPKTWHSALLSPAFFERIQ